MANNPNAAKNLIPFKKGDIKINRRGRPKSFDMWRKLNVQILQEVARDKDGVPIIVDRGLPTEHIATNAEMVSRSWLKSDKRQQALIEAAYGKVPDKLELTGRVDLSTLTDHQLLRLKNGDNVLDVLADKS